MKRKEIWIILLLVSVSVLLNLPILNNQYLYWDDNYNFFKNENLQKPWRSWEDIKWIFSFDQTLRLAPISWLVWKFIYTVWGLDPMGVRIVSLLFHTTNVVLIFLIAKRVLEKTTPHYVLISAIISLVWLTNPLRVEPVAWATAITYPNSTLIALLGIYTLLRNQHGKVIYDLLGYILLLLSTLAYPLTLMVPLTGPIWVVLRHKNIGIGKKDLKQNIILCLLSFVWVIYLTIQTKTASFPRNIPITITESIEKFTTNFTTALNNLLYIVYTSVFTPSIVSPAHYPGEDLFYWKHLLGTILIASCIVLAYKKQYRSLLLLIAGILSALPAIRLGEGSMLPVDRYAYLSSIVFLLTIGSFIKKIPRWGIALILGYTAINSYIYISKEKIWNTPISLLEHVAEQKATQNYPKGMLVVYWNLAEYYKDKHEYFVAYGILSQIGELDFLGSKEKEFELKRNLAREVLLGQSKDNYNSLEFLKFLEEKNYIKKNK
jgi:hypothetical protein